MMIPWCAAVLVVVCFVRDVGSQEHKRPDFSEEIEQHDPHDAFSDPHELQHLLDGSSTYYIPDLNPDFLPRWAPPKFARDRESEDKNILEMQKRISRLVVDPHSKRWSEVFRISPKAFREFRNNGQRIPPYFRKGFVDGGFKMSYGPARKRPYYYTEPEGSEFLGGPGK